MAVILVSTLTPRFIPASRRARKGSIVHDRHGTRATELWLAGSLLAYRKHTFPCSAQMADNDLQKRKAVVVGGGWAGFGAAHQLAKAGFQVTLLDASPTPGGLSGGSRTSSGRAVEAGIKGFWWQYHNIYALMNELQIKDPFTDWTRSTFYSPGGIVVEAPVFHELPRLPAPLGSFFYTSPYFRTLPVADRLSAIPLLRALIEFDVDEEAYQYYDAMTARELFRSSGVSARLYSEFLEPILLVTLFAPPEKLSAAAALGALYYYVLAHQADFDVRWCRGPVTEVIFGPWISAIEALGGRVRGGCRVKEVHLDCHMDGGNAKSLGVAVEGSEEVVEADVFVFAVGVRAMQGIVSSSPALAALPMFRAVMDLSAVDVLATRLWLDRRVPMPTPSNVVAGFDKTTGATFFDLCALQDEYMSEEGSVVEVDFYHANQMLALSNDDIAQMALKKYLAGCEAGFAGAQILDASVQRFPKAVTLFSPGSHRSMPEPTTPVPNLFLAGDWLRQGPGSHGARGLSQEKAYVTGLQAANAAAMQQGVDAIGAIRPVESDEAHYALAKEGAREVRRRARDMAIKWPLL